MSDSRNKKNSGGDPQLHYIKNPNAPQRENFARVHRSAAYSDAMRKLPHYCLKLYVLLILECKGQGENKTCVFPQKLWSMHFNERTFKKARDLLEEAGFITYTKSNSTKMTIYTLSDRWWKDEPAYQMAPTFYEVNVKVKK